MDALLSGFVDELEKISIELNAEENRRQALQFGALGAAFVPATAALANKIEHGSFIPSMSNPKRWVAARVASGALTAGALPLLRHHIERKNIQAAKIRRKEGL